MTGRELEYISEVIDSNYLNDGDVTARFERAVADRLGARYAVAVTSGTTAIFAALMAAGVGRGDEVIIPDLTFIATANAVTLTGATPVLVDIDPDRLTMDPAAVAAAVTSRTRAIVPVHVSGRATDMAAIDSIARQHGLAVVEDAAESFVSCHAGKPLGTFGLAGCLSFSPNKTITTGQGGMVVTNDEALAGRVRELKDQGRPVRGTGGDDQHPTIGFNLKFTNLQAAVGLAQIEHLDERLGRQRGIHQRYSAGLAGLEGVRILNFDIAAGETPLWTDVLVERRDALDAYLSESGMGCRRFWLPIHTQTPYQRDGRGLERAASASARALWLPSAFTLTDEDIDLVCGAIRTFLAA